ncbi:hypothetical protein I3W98_40815 [Streptomyces cavourensis]|nr:hypothetical protein [Streptomyces cavourensis]
MKATTGASSLTIKGDDVTDPEMGSITLDLAVDSTIKMIGDRWLKSDASSEDAKDMAALCDLDELLSEFKDVKSPRPQGRDDHRQRPGSDHPDREERQEHLRARRGDQG